MIVTLTPNPSIDRTLSLPSLGRGAVNRATTVTDEAGGKGLNVARAIADMAGSAVAVLPASAASRQRIVELVGDVPPTRFVTIEGPIRVNLSLVEPDGTVTKVNEPGPTMTEAEVDDMLGAAVAAAAHDATDWVVGCGSLPPGAPDDVYGRLAERLAGRARIAVDADRAALRAAVRWPLDLIKPNRAELEELAGRPLATLEAVVAAATEVANRGVERVLVSLGPDGAVLVDRTGRVTYARTTIGDAVNPVGAGDALLAGFLAGGADHEALPEALAWATAACRAPGTRMPPVSDRDRAAVVVATDVDRSLALVS